MQLLKYFFPLLAISQANENVFYSPMKCDKLLRIFALLSETRLFRLVFQFMKGTKINFRFDGTKL